MANQEPVYAWHCCPNAGRNSSVSTDTGFDGASLYVPHPMQNRTTAELHRFAGEVFEEILGALRSG